MREMWARLIVLIGLWGLMSSCWADQVVLHNGDILEGTFKGVVDENVLWRSAQFGDLKIAKTRVKKIHSEQAFKLRGQSTPCVWQGLDQRQRASFVCHKGQIRRFSLLSLKQVVPFEGHELTNHSYKGNLRITGLKKTGNVESEDWEVRSGVVLRDGDWRHSVTFSMAGQSLTLRDGVQETVNETRKKRGEYVLDWFFLPQYYWSNSVSAESDGSRNIQEEYKVSSGLGYQFWETTEAAFAMVVGLEHNRTYLKLNPPVNEPESYTSVRLGTDARYRFQQRLNLYHNNVYSRALDAQHQNGTADRWEFKSTSGMDFPIGFGISADMHVEWSYKNHAKDQNPFAFRKDAIYRVGVNYAW